MPSTGTPSSSSSGRSSGAPSEYTDAGPPERTRAAGLRSRIRSSAAVCGKSSAKTPHSRTLRAMSWEYCPPKSRTSTSSVIADGNPLSDRGATVGAHAHRLLALQLLALGLDRRGDHHLGALEIADVLVPTGGHRGAERAHQVEGAVVLLRGPEEDLLERPVLKRGHAGAARERGMEGRHSPVEPAARGSLRAGQRRADHHRVRAAGERLRDVAA